MKKTLWKLLQISWLVLAIFIASKSILALNNDADYCSGINCWSNNDCSSPCVCDKMDYMCYNPGKVN
ncbi:MAG: hypothetical protein J2P21_17420 [Chloracidobacterium sp.]|nr:hypothetical protein [Chloracidobacterium sp.]